MTSSVCPIGLYTLLGLHNQPLHSNMNHSILVCSSKVPIHGFNDLSCDLALHVIYDWLLLCAHTHTHTHSQLPHQGTGSEGDLRSAALSERYDPNLEGLTLATYLKEPGQIISKAVGLFGLDPIEEEGVVVEEGKGMSVSSFGETEEEVFMCESEDGAEGDHEGVFCCSNLFSVGKTSCY